MRRRHGVIHRDIKPANILLHDGRPLIADFGIALAISAAGGGRLTETGLSLGTPHYMSPEQASAERDLSARSDVYSAGCVLYEMLSGEPPHTGPNAAAILMRILTEQPRLISDLRPSVPAHVAGAVTKALEKLPADRFETARQVWDRDRDAAEALWKRAVSLNPRLAQARVVYGTWYLALTRGRFDEAEVETREAMALDPLSSYVLATRALSDWSASVRKPSRDPSLSRNARWSWIQVRS